MTAQDNERRRFSRIRFDAQTRLHQDQCQIEVKLLDISLKGLLTQTSRARDLDLSQPIRVDIQLDEQTGIQMETRAVHHGNEQLGLQCICIEVESIAHLRRLIELNLGDARAAERELTELSTF